MLMLEALFEGVKSQGKSVDSESLGPVASTAEPPKPDQGVVNLGGLGKF